MILKITEDESHMNPRFVTQLAKDIYYKLQISWKQISRQSIHPKQQSLIKASLFLEYRQMLSFFCDI